MTSNNQSWLAPIENSVIGPFHKNIGKRKGKGHRGRDIIGINITSKVTWRAVQTVWENCTYKVCFSWKSLYEGVLHINNSICLKDIEKSISNKVITIY